MIIDHISRAARYHGVGAGIRTALEYLAATEFAQVRAGRHELDGERVFALVQE